MFTRRSLLFSPLISMIFDGPSFSAPVAPIHLPPVCIADAAAGIRFNLDINDDVMLTGTFEAPTIGWLAVGLNATDALEGTRFVMAARNAANTLIVEEHLAKPPAHYPVAQFDAAPMFETRALKTTGGGTRLYFAASRNVPAPHPLDVTPGRNVGLMLAWSHEPDFTHHSAWRQHFIIKV